MTADSYAPCPCGSGKKVKFCCQAILADMEKVERLLENNQPRMALQSLEKVLPQHAGNPWVATAQGWALLADHRPAEAKAALAQFLRKNPDHPSANALHALAAFQTDGLPTAKKAIHRAFRRSFQAEPTIVTGLAASMAESLLRAGHVLAARQHLALALRYGDEEDRKAAFSGMVDIDSDSTIPYPLRGVHNFPEYAGKPETQEAVQKAHRLSAAGCWEEAAETFRPVVEQDPNSAAAWHTLGMFLAWDGNDDAASEALRKAAQLTEDFETAVECETLAQLLYSGGDERKPLQTLTAPVASVSKLLTRLDERPNLVRTPQGAMEATGLSSMLAAQYELVDRPIPSEPELKEITLETVPMLLARIMVTNQSQSEGDGDAQS
ncbi:MAG: hypothetical protein KF847_20810, partial [Pirellulales bacterium]|nr:hypothetical protein [Pirellulales bacterium]